MQELRSIALAENEASLHINSLPSVNSITFYEGVPNFNYIQQRVDEILRLNPWLCGTLVKHWWSQKLYLEYYENYKHPLNVRNSSVVIIEREDLSVPSDYDNTFAFCDPNVRKHIVKIGFPCWNNKYEYLFRVIIVTNSSSTSNKPVFALIISMSHVIADGFTYYKIFNMISENSTPQEMIVDRVYNFIPTIRKVPYIWINTLWMIIKIFVDIIWNPLLKKNLLNFVPISSDKISTLKKRLISSSLDDNRHECKYLSTNDIITSEFLNCIDCDVGLMAVNFRNRFPGVTDNHAGCYQLTLALSKEELSSPFNLRSVLNSVVQGNFNPHINLNRNIPKGYEVIGRKFALVTNWSSFYKDLKIPGNQLIVHTPLMLFNASVIQVGIIFRPKEGNNLVMWTNRRINGDQNKFQKYQDLMS